MPKKNTKMAKNEKSAKIRRDRKNNEPSFYKPVKPVETKKILKLAILRFELQIHSNQN